MIKKCFKCGIEKDLIEFYRHKQMADGHLNKCKECAKKDVAARYASEDGIRKIVAYEKLRFKNPERKSKVLEYQRKRRRINKHKDNARAVVSMAISSGKLKRLPCEECQDPNVEAHHEDYSKPLDVKWLCRKHHLKRHKKNSYEFPI